MKALAIIDVAPNTDRSALQHRLHEELNASWALYCAGGLREIYATDRPTRVVFVLESQDLSAASDLLKSLPLVKLGYFDFQLIELRAFSNWSMLFAPKIKP